MVKAWLILIAASMLFGVAAICFNDGPVLDAPLAVPPEAVFPDGGQVTPAAPSPENASPSPPAPGSRENPAPTSPEPASPSAVETPPSTTASPPVPAVDPELFDLLRDLLAEFETTGEVSDQSRAELAAWLAGDPQTALAAVHFVFNALPEGLARVRHFLFQALLDIDRPEVTAEIKRRIDEKRRELVAGLPKTLEQTCDALLFGEPAYQCRVVRALKPSDLADPTVFDYLRTAARNPNVSWQLRGAAITALGRVRSRESAALLVDLLATAGQPGERAAVLRALVKHVPIEPQVTQVMLDHVFDRRQPEPVRRFAVNGLAGAPRSAEVKNTLLEVLRREEDVYMRRAAIGGLRNYRDEADLRDALRAHREHECDREVLAAIERILAR